MLYILLGLVAAMWVGLAAHFFRNSEALFYVTWVDPLFWSLIGAGILVALVRNLYCPVIHCMLRKVSRRAVPFPCPGVSCGDPP